MATEKLYQLDIVTPEKKVYTDKVTFSVFPGSEGELGILANHAPLLARLLPGEIKIERDSTTEYIAISGGFLEVRKNEVSVIAETAEFAKDIDKSRAQKAKAAAEADLKNASIETEKPAIQLRLQKAIARLKVAEKSASPQ